MKKIIDFFRNLLTKSGKVSGYLASNSAFFTDKKTRDSFDYMLSLKDDVIFYNSKLNDYTKTFCTEILERDLSNHNQSLANLYKVSIDHYPIDVPQHTIDEIKSLLHDAFTLYPMQMAELISIYAKMVGTSKEIEDLDKKIRNSIAEQKQ